MAGNTTLPINEFSELVLNKQDDELLKMVYEFDQWSPQMLFAVEAELNKRNLLPADISLKKQEIISNEDAELSQGKEASMLGMLMGWIGILGLIGLIVGYRYSFAKKRSKYTGKVYFKYDESTRKNGHYIFYTAIIIFTLYFLYKMVTLYN